MKSVLDKFRRKFSQDPLPYYFVFCCVFTLVGIKIYTSRSNNELTKEQYLVKEISSYNAPKKLEALHEMFKGKGWKIRSNDFIDNITATKNSNIQVTLPPVEYFKDDKLVSFAHQSISVMSPDDTTRYMNVNESYSKSTSYILKDNGSLVNYYGSYRLDSFRFLYLNNNNGLDYLHDLQTSETNTYLSYIDGIQLMKAVFYPKKDSLVLYKYENFLSFNSSSPARTFPFRAKEVDAVLFNKANFVYRFRKNGMYYIVNVATNDTGQRPIIIDSSKNISVIFGVGDKTVFLHNDSSKNSIFYYYYHDSIKTVSIPQKFYSAAFLITVNE